MSEDQAGYDVGVISIESHETAAAATELRPCPFCGQTKICGIDDMEMYCTVSCDACEAEGPPADSIDEAIRAWNTRPGVDVPMVRALVDEMIQLLADTAGIGTGYQHAARRRLAVALGEG